MVIQAVSQITHQIVHIDELLIAVFAISTVVVSNFILHIKWLCHIESIQPDLVWINFFVPEITS